MPGDAPTIPYESGAGRRRGRLPLRLVAAALLITGAALAYINWPALTAHVRPRWLTRQCLNWHAPPDTIMFQCSPRAAKQLLADQLHRGRKPAMRPLRTSNSPPPSPSPP